MSPATAPPQDGPLSRTRPRGKEWLWVILVVVLGSSIPILTSLNARVARQRVAIIKDLRALRVDGISYEVTTLGLIRGKLSQSQSMGLDLTSTSKGWARPVGFNGSKVREEDLPRVIESLQQLGTVREFVTPRGKWWAVTDRQERHLRRSLPDAKISIYEP